MIKNTSPVSNCGIILHFRNGETRTRSRVCNGMKRGFTVVELIIVITVMTILLSIAMATIYSSQSDARDTERREDAETIALHLETYYNSGKDGDTAAPGKYPPTSFLVDSATTHIYLRDLDDVTVTAPGVSSPLTTFIAATDNTAQSPTIDQYIYQPLQSDGSLCTTDVQTCVKFNLYYRLEKDNTVQIVKSKNQ